MRVEVFNRYKGVPKEYKYVYIGRPSAFGNPFPVGENFTRDEAVEAHAEYFRSLPEDHEVKEGLRKLLESGSDIALVCFCKPKACHGDILREYLMEEYNGRNET